MASQKQSLPSFASILSVLSIVFYCAGFLRVELELNEQKKRINDLENKRENMPPMFSLRSSRLEVVGTRTGAREGDTRGQRKRLH